MRHRAILLLASALALGLISVALARQWLGHKPAAALAPPDTATVVVARSALAAGTRLTRDDLSEIAWPAASVPPGALSSIDTLLADKERGAVVRPIDKGEPVLASKLGAQGRPGLSAQIGGDRRAITIRVNDVLGVAGFVLPGDRVDVLLTRDLGPDNPVTDVLLQRVKVLGIDQEASERKDKPMVARAVTLEVSPEEAQRITLATEVGTLSLSLRNLADSGDAHPRTVGLADLRHVAAPAPRGRGDGQSAVRVLRGTVAAEVKVPQDRDGSH